MSSWCGHTGINLPFLFHQQFCLSVLLSSEGCTCFQVPRLEVECSSSGTIFAQVFKYTKTTNLYTLNGWIIWHVNYLYKGAIYFLKDNVLPCGKLPIKFWGWRTFSLRTRVNKCFRLSFHAPAVTTHLCPWAPDRQQKEPAIPVMPYYRKCSTIFFLND